MKTPPLSRLGLLTVPKNPKCHCAVFFSPRQCQKTTYSTVFDHLSMFMDFFPPSRKCVLRSAGLAKRGRGFADPKLKGAGEIGRRGEAQGFRDLRNRKAGFGQKLAGFEDHPVVQKIGG
jgi:hypothetical protein